MAAVTIHSDFGVQENKVCHYLVDPDLVKVSQSDKNTKLSLCLLIFTNSHLAFDMEYHGHRALLMDHKDHLLQFSDTNWL